MEQKSLVRTYPIPKAGFILRLGMVRETCTSPVIENSEPNLLIPSEIAHHSDFKSPVIPK
jgi:hypothetical protein